jgi:carbon monoxide dehydrogenase subunit G
MATVSVEAVVRVPPEAVWAAVADVGNVDRRLLPGRVSGVALDGDVRVLTMPDGSEIRELIVSVDHSARRMAYSVTGGQRLPLTYHQAAFQVFAEGVGSRLVWTTDLLPHAMAPAVRARVERGIVEIKATLEATGVPAAEMGWPEGELRA